jgi:RNA polymerase sigma-70 factor (ECF subfamily)
MTNVGWLLITVVGDRHGAVLTSDPGKTTSCRDANEVMAPVLELPVSVARGARERASPVPDSHPHRAVPDEESRDWLAALASDGPDRDAALARLHDLMVRAARFEVGRRRRSLPRLPARELDDLVQQAADDALVALLGKLQTFRGTSRFTTWAYKFALLEAGVRLRRRAWQGREVPLGEDAGPWLVDMRPSPHADAETAEVLTAIRTAIARELTPHQRDVLVAITLDDVPIDVLAERLSTTRGALYKTLHDARRKLRACLAQQGLTIGDRA